MVGRERYGALYWFIQTEDDAIHVFADKIEILPNGDLVAWRIFEEEGSKPERQINFAVAAGQWEYCYAASALDGGAIAVEHWNSSQGPGPSRSSRGRGAKRSGDLGRRAASRPGTKNNLVPRAKPDEN